MRTDGVTLLMGKVENKLLELFPSFDSIMWVDVPKVKNKKGKV